MTAPLWQREFPDFTAAELPAIPATWVDLSWHNDISPSFSATPDALAGTGISVWVDYADVARREFGEGDRFGVYMTDLGGERSHEWSSNDWEAVLVKVAEWAPIWSALVATQEE